MEDQVKTALLADESCCDSICESFERDFRHNCNLSIEEYVARYRTSGGREVVRAICGLVHSELELRLRRDETVSLWEYLDRFPDINDDSLALISILKTELRIKCQRKQTIDRVEYMERYPLLPIEELMFDVGIGFPKVPGYQIVEEIGRGGMGVVYRALDLTLRRDVAIKVILQKVGSNSSECSLDRMERFRREATITGRLEHPGIPPVHAYGCLENGQPFLVMKLIRGQTLATFLNSRVKTGENLLQCIHYFENVAQAVGFAHSVGIVHRDLKPNNVMIGAFGEVQVMDWGLAKEVSCEELVESEVLADCDLPTPLSHMGQIIGTPEYMAPEQARREDVDARADVFGLGAILAAIITGHPVFAGSSAQDLISKAACGDVSDVLRRLESESLDKEILSLAKDCLAVVPAERPSNGMAVAQRIADYRAGVEFRLRAAETARTVAQVRMNEQHARKRILQTLVAVLLLGVLASGLFSWQSNISRVEAEAANHNEKESRLAAEDAAKLAEKLNRTAELRLVQIERGVEIFAGLLSGISPRNEEEGVSVYEQICRRAEIVSAELENDAITDGLSLAKLQTILGHSLVELGSPLKAVDILSKAYAIRKRELGDKHTDTIKTRTSLAYAYWFSGDFQIALPMLEQVYELRSIRGGLDDMDTRKVMNVLACAYRESGKVGNAIELHEKLRDSLPQNHDFDTNDLSNLSNLATAYVANGERDKAIELYHRVIDERKKRSSPDHAATLNVLSNLAAVYCEVGNFQKAIPMQEEVLRARKRTVGNDHPATITCLNNLAVTFRDSGQLERAIPLFEEAAQRISNRNFAHQHAVRIVPNTIRAYEQTLQWEMAESWNRKWLGFLATKSEGRNSIAFSNELERLGINLLSQQEWAEAEVTFRECYSIRYSLDPNGWLTYCALAFIGETQIGQGLMDEGVEALRKGCHGMRSGALNGSEEVNSRLHRSLQCLVDAYTELGNHEQVKHYQTDVALLKP
jgi:serine/threonine protein kinase/tetratricopeptide (TPR) repeat protein